jgi:hypothetical protein
LFERPQRDKKQKSNEGKPPLPDILDYKVPTHVFPDSMRRAAGVDLSRAKSPQEQQAIGDIRPDTMVEMQNPAAVKMEEYSQALRAAAPPV